MQLTVLGCGDAFGNQGEVKHLFFWNRMANAC